MNQVPLRVERLTKIFEPTLWAKIRYKKRPFTAVNNISFSLRQGEILGFLGPNGAGKTTTIQMLLDVLTPTSGSVEYVGKNLFKHHDVLQNVSFASGYTRLPSSLMVYQCLLTHGMLYNMSLEELRAKIPPILDEFGISHLADRNASTLSAGQTTCVLLARTFLVEPQVVLLDEPTAALDPENAHLVRTFIKKLNQEKGTSILFTSHNMVEVAELCDRILILKNGVIIADDTPESLASSISEAHVQLVFVDQLHEAIAFAQQHNLNFSAQERHIDIVINEQKIAELLESLAHNKLRYSQISIDKPTLEDYFLTIARKGKS
ncbi:MAG: MtrA protein [candidate division TM6 bacterium GW2011_GWE2_36_25]|nr:MAG: MtrA protein [candidate division TM6 bacterium GW2011_GWF2_36_131]KKQ03144.1 MAG: MtrA protein [candidate division TM6 bacterium GW2011_GWE2_36_25]KKQ19368.1 MAG: MtrA protein [candidate division TM6 bacterium GW2011_GWA2_36_9]